MALKAHLNRLARPWVQTLKLVKTVVVAVLRIALMLPHAASALHFSKKALSAATVPTVKCRRVVKTAAVTGSHAKTAKVSLAASHVMPRLVAMAPVNLTAMTTVVAVNLAAATTAEAVTGSHAKTAKAHVVLTTAHRVAILMIAHRVVNGPKSAQHVAHSMVTVPLVVILMTAHHVAISAKIAQSATSETAHASVTATIAVLTLPVTAARAAVSKTVRRDATLRTVAQTAPTA